MRFLWVCFVVVGCEPSADQKRNEGDETFECEPRSVDVPTSNFFRDISNESGIQAGNYDPDPPDGIVINDHSRLAFADINGDGFDDAVMHSLYPNPANGIPFEHLVFINNGDGTFTDHSDESGLRDIQAAFFAFADMDNDGDQDAYAGLDLPNYGSYRSAILLNDGTGTFTPLEDAGVGGYPSLASTAVFGDFNSDGNVDLFVGNGHTSYAVADAVYWGNGDGSFDIDTSALTDPPEQPSNGSVACDYDDDGDLDIFVATYGVSASHGHNHLWQNNDGQFVNVAREAGFESLVTGNYILAETDHGVEPEPDVTEAEQVGSNAFGIDCGDADGDGDLDIWMTAISHPVATDPNRKWSDPSQLLQNQGDGTFVNVYLEKEIPFNEGDIDAAMVDFDNDGRMDLSVTRDPKYEGRYSEDEQLAWFGLMWQRDNHSFASVGVTSGINADDDDEWERMRGGQNHAWSDIDHDGDLDLLVGGRDQGGGRPNFLFENNLGQEQRWVAISVEGDGDSVHRDAFGTRIVYDWGDEQIIREKRSSRGTYNSEDSRVIHVGIGDRDCSAEISIIWPDGTVVPFKWSDIGHERFVRISYPDEILD
jgi:hypothetical protein